MSTVSFQPGLPSGSGIRLFGIRRFVPKPRRVGEKARQQGTGIDESRHEKLPAHEDNDHWVGWPPKGSWNPRR